jgi:hypothetical protein
MATTPELLAHIVRVTYALCAPSSDDGLLLPLASPTVKGDDWHYLAYGGVSLAEIISPGITMKPLK